jgi:amino acid transporter
MATMVTPTPAAAPARSALRRQLHLLGAVAVSIGVMAPTLAMSVTGVEPARLLGRAAPLAFAFAAVGVALVAYGFVRLSSEFAHAGSVYGFVGHAFGPRAGFFCGWALLGTYLVFPAVSMSGVAVFGEAFLKSTGIASDFPWYPLALFGWAVIGLAASREVRKAISALVVFEVVAFALIIVLMAAIVISLIGGDVPGDQTFNTDVVKLPPGTSLSTIGLAAVFGFLSYAGFESAGSFGEEAHEPRRTIPYSLWAAIVFGGVFYFLCMSIQTLGFGTGAAGVKAFSSSEAPLGDLAHMYMGRGMADALNMAAVISSFGAGMGCASVGARMLFALGRDRVLAGELGAVRSANGTPGVALAFVLALDLALLTIFAIAGTPPLKVFFYLATFGTLSLLVMYIATNLAAARFLTRGARPWEALIPLVGIAVAGYVLYHNVHPVPDPPFDLFPYLVGGWLLLGVLVILFVPGLHERVSRGLEAADATQT